MPSLGPIARNQIERDVEYSDNDIPGDFNDRLNDIEYGTYNRFHKGKLELEKSCNNSKRRLKRNCYLSPKLPTNCRNNSTECAEYHSKRIPSSMPYGADNRQSYLVNAGKQTDISLSHIK